MFLSRSLALSTVTLSALVLTACGAQEYGLNEVMTAPDARGVALDQDDGRVFTAVGQAVCEADVDDEEGLIMTDTDVEMEDLEVLDAEGGHVLVYNGMEVVVVRPDHEDVAEVPVDDGTPVGGQLHDGDVVLVTDTCKLTFALSGETVELPAGSCDGRLLSGAGLIWHASNGTVYSIEEGEVIDVGTAAHVAFHKPTGQWAFTIDDTLTLRSLKGDIAWTYTHRTGLESSFPFADTLGVRDQDGDVFALDADGSFDRHVAWVGTSGVVVGSPDGAILYLENNGLQAIRISSSTEF